MMKTVMKKTLFIVLLLTACVNYMWSENPYYYDDCWYASIPFTFPLEREIKDTVWYTATLDDIKRGVSASWYSDVSVTIDVYAFCTSKIPSFSLTVGPNQLREMEVEKINKKIEEMGEMAQMMAQTLTPHIRIYPNNKGKGTVYCYPYDQGPVSTCNDILPVFAKAANVCSAPSNVYVLTPERMSSYGRGFIVWKQKKNMPATIYVTKDSCNGPEIGRSVLKDSIYVMTLDSVEVKAAKQAGKNLYIHVEHPEDYVGRIIYHNNIIRNAQLIDTTFCHGKRLELRDTVLLETTVYSKDTMWTGGDTLSWTTVKLTVEPVEPQFDTLRLSASQLPKSYRNIYIPKDGWGDYTSTIRKKNTCDQLWYIHVQHLYTTQHERIDTVICQGKGYAFGDKLYSTDTTAVDSAWITPDIWAVDTIKVTIQESDLEYDTVIVAPSKITAGYTYAPYNIVLNQYGDTLVTASQKGQCDRRILVTVLKGEEIITASPYPILTPTAAGKYLKEGQIVIIRNGNRYDLLGRKYN